MKRDTKGDIAWWRKLQRAWFTAKLVWRDPDWVGRTITLDQDTFSRVVWGGDGVLIRGYDGYDGGRVGLIQEHLDPWQVRAARGLRV